MSAPPNALGDTSSTTTDARRTEHLATDEQELARTELTALPVGIPLPSAISNLTAPPPATTATTSTTPSTAPTLNASSSSSSDSIQHEKNLSGEDAKIAAQLAAEKEKLAPSKKSFFSRRKAKDAEEKKGKQKEDELSSLPPIKLFALFRFATKFEIMLDIIGIILAAAAGAAQPL
jgi:ATP-binding cassette subfamily B (MDR/TAP) protein 1